MKTAELFGWALGGLEREISQTRERLASLNAQAAKLRVRLGRAKGQVETAAPDDAVAPVGKKRRRRKMSPEARKRMSELTKKRWADRKRKGLTRL
jgi:hypothetical protein